MTRPDHSGDHPDNGSDADARPSPRAFATATGYICQIVGLVILVASVGYWLVSGCVQRPAPVRVDTFADYVAPANLPLTITMLNVLCGVAGGMGMTAAGIGLQSERRGSGIAAMISTGVLAVIEWTSVVAYLVLGSARVAAAVVAVAAAANTVLFLLAGHSADVLKRHPPPPNDNVVDDAWLEQYARRRGKPDP